MSFYNKNKQLIQFYAIVVIQNGVLTVINGLYLAFYSIEHRGGNFIYLSMMTVRIDFCLFWV